MRNETMKDILRMLKVVGAAAVLAWACWLIGLERANGSPLNEINSGYRGDMWIVIHFTDMPEDTPEKWQYQFILQDEGRRCHDYFAHYVLKTRGEDNYRYFACYSADDCQSLWPVSCKDESYVDAWFANNVQPTYRKWCMYGQLYENYDFKQIGMTHGQVLEYCG